MLRYVQHYLPKISLKVVIFSHRKDIKPCDLDLSYSMFSLYLINYTIWALFSTTQNIYHAHEICYLLALIQLTQQVQ